MFDAKPLQVGFVLLQSLGFIAFHNSIVANPGCSFHAFRVAALPSEAEQQHQSRGAEFDHT